MVPSLSADLILAMRGLPKATFSKLPSGEEMAGNAGKSSFTRFDFQETLQSTDTLRLLGS